MGGVQLNIERGLATARKSLAIVVALLAACGGTEKSGSDASKLPVDSKAETRSSEDDRYRCMCDPCGPWCGMAELWRESDAWGFDYECFEGWRFDWCEQAECGFVDGQCMLIGPEPIVDRTEDILETAADYQGPNDLGQPCEANNQCDGFVCLDTALGHLCSFYCSQWCPDGYTCAQIMDNGPDHFFACLPDCIPNCEGQECGDDGCGAICGECAGNELCCAGSCHQPGCMVTNEFGECAGFAECVGGELVCDAPKAIPEQCDGLDNDCNGQIDEGLSVLPCEDNDGVPSCMDDDHDNDNIPDFWDNCVCQANPEQVDTDLDGLGDECDEDDDNDQVPDDADCAPLDDSAYPGATEACNGKDDDCDGESDQGLGETTCGLGACTHTVSNCSEGQLVECDPLQGTAPDLCDGLDNDCDGPTDETFPDADGDELADCVDLDDDGDGLADGGDNCSLVPNPGQEDSDNDDIGDACDGDTDGDGLSNEDDNCIAVANPGQIDTDQDGLGDACDPDDDGDGEPDSIDCAPLVAGVSHLNAESCNGIDDDCDGQIDEVDAEGCIPYWVDEDGDGWAGPQVCYCDQPSNAKDSEGDCCDADPLAFPGQTKSFAQPIKTCGGFDYNCDGSEDPQFDSSCVEEPCTAGWFQPAPTCGEVGEWCLNCNGCGSCIGQPILQAQKCR
jgi:hypothetical protein